MAAEKMYAFTKMISETKLWLLLSQHADETRLDIHHPVRKGNQRRLENGGSPLLLAPPQKKEKKERLTGSRTIDSLSFMVLAHLADNPKRIITNEELYKMATDNGRSLHGISVAMTGFLKKGFVERTGAGQYKILKEGIAHVSVKREQARVDGEVAKTGDQGKGHPIRRANKSRSMVLLALARLNAPTPVSSFRQPIVDAGLKAASVHGVFNYLRAKGFVTRKSAGVYQITKEGRAHAATIEASKETAP